jgi:hypothetical protein
MTSDSSYYTGYEDLDKKLSKLYEEQVKIESEKPTLENSARHGQIIRRQDNLLLLGKIRDRRSAS